MKICTKCGSAKDSFLFTRRKQSTDDLSSWCRDCYRENWNVRYRENHRHYRNSHNASRSKIREQNARQIFEYLKKHPCVNCQESDPIVLEFDHRNGFDKIESISNLIRDASWSRIEQEIEKCDVLCANCHRRKSAAQFGYKRYIYVSI